MSWPRTVLGIIGERGTIHLSEDGKATKCGNPVAIYAKLGAIDPRGETVVASAQCQRSGCKQAWWRWTELGGVVLRTPIVAGPHSLTNVKHPPFKLIQLSLVSQHIWKSLPVFHPHHQVGDTPRWLSDDEDDFGKAAYDVGVVTEWGLDPDFGDLGIIRVTFVGSNGSTLKYASTNLWVPESVLMNWAC